MATKEKLVALQLAFLLREYRVRHIVVSPGSRNAPLIVALARSKSYDIHYIVDERTAAFAALGMAVTLDSPVALVCTSGSAVLNYGPALAEAYYSNIPLIAISADRPYYDIERNQAQTIRQAGIFNDIVRYSVDIRDGEDAIYSNRLINNALSHATEGPGGPVHINVQFEMPLNCSDTEEDFQAWRLSTMITHPFPGDMRYNSGQRYLIVIGGLKPDRNLDVCRELLEELPKNVIVIAEAQSNLSEFSAIPSADFTANLDRIDEPDNIIIAGGPLVSADLNRWIDNRTEICMHIDPTGRLYDCDSRACSLTLFLSVFISLVNQSYGRTVNYMRCLSKAKSKSSATPVSGLIEKLSGLDINLHLSNGMTIREAQKIRIKPCTEVWSNRGVSGIEGCTSTAIGASMVSEKPVVLISGDMSAAYDVGALSVNGVSGNFTMIVVNNHGGEIFRRVATTCDLPEREMYFTAMPKFPLSKLAEAYGFEYQTVTDIEEITLADGKQAKIIELKINTENYA